MITISERIHDLLVVKIGGGRGLSIDRCIADLAVLARQRPVVLIHGVSERANQLCEQTGVPVTFLTSTSGHQSRYTDVRTRDIFVQAAEEVNRELCEALWRHGIQASGFVGEDVVLHGERKRAIRVLFNGRQRIIRDDHSGTISSVDIAPLVDVIKQGVIPVLPPMALSKDGLLNVDGDRVSAAVAKALSADELIILSNVNGLLRNAGDGESLVSRVAQAQVDEAMAWAQGRMKRKVLGAHEALQGQVRRVIIADGRIDRPIQQALKGTGTEFVR